MKQYALLLAFLAATTAQTCSISQNICATLSGGSVCPNASLNAVTLGDNSYSGSEFDVISFGQITLTTGDIQGRAISQGNLYSTGGTSVADLISASNILSLIIGGDLIYSGNGEVYPLNTSIFVEGSATVPANLQSRIINCASLSLGDNCLSTSFANLQSYYTSISNLLAQGSTNIATCSDNGVLYLNCQNSNTIVNFINVDVVAFNNITGYCISPVCSSSAIFVFNIGGTGDVVFSGVAIQLLNYVVYNVLATAANRNIIINTSVNGNILAVDGNLVQNAGTISGQVVVANATNIIQVNRPFCPSLSRQNNQPASNVSSCNTSSKCYQATAAVTTSSTMSTASATTAASATTHATTATTASTTSRTSEANIIAPTIMAVMATFCVVIL